MFRNLLTQVAISSKNFDLWRYYQTFHYRENFGPWGDWNDKKSHVKNNVLNFWTRSSTYSTDNFHYDYCWEFLWKMLSLFAHYETILANGICQYLNVLKRHSSQLCCGKFLLDSGKLVELPERGNGLKNGRQFAEFSGWLLSNGDFWTKFQKGFRVWRW